MNEQPSDARQREAERLVLVMAPSFQGGHSKTGDEVAAFLGIPFPIVMPALEKAARMRGFDPAKLWPWYEKMKRERASVRNE
ncbi:hypothetical protein [Teichococcus aestuarii]|uniref:hypothetical protein n=1 Tax=Teichococcus aestuarii TaxID=568898 RepID=UPI00361EC7B8